MNPIEELGKQSGIWAEYGLEGLVILALFVLVGAILFFFTKEFRSYRSEHANERKEWRTSAEASSERVGTAFDNLAAAIRERKV